MSWVWPHNLFHGCSATYPLHHSGQLIIGVEETNQNEEIVRCNREELFSIRTNTTCSGQLIIGVEETNQIEEIEKCNREELFSNRANLEEVEIAF